MEWLVSLFISGVVVVLIDLGLRKSGRSLRSSMERRVSRYRRRHRSLAGGPEPLASAVMPEHFKEVGPTVLDVGIYELSLRPDIPMMDLLYFEYLRRRLASGTLRSLFVVPWNGRGEVDKIKENEVLLISRLEKVFGDVWGSVTVVRAHDLDQYASHLLSEHFMDSLEDLGNSDFLKKSSRTLGYKFRSYHDINSGHPESLQARSLVEHSIRGWLIFRYLVEGGYVQIPEGATTLRVGSILWERELSKLLLLRNLEENEPSIEIGLMIGKDVTFRSGLVRRPVPTYLGAIGLFQDLAEVDALCAKKSKAELAAISDLVTETYSGLPRKVTLRAPRSGAVAKTNSARHSSTLLVQLQQLRDAYGIN